MKPAARLLALTVVAALLAGCGERRASAAALPDPAPARVTAGAPSGVRHPVFVVAAPHHADRPTPERLRVARGERQRCW